MHKILRFMCLFAAAFAGTTNDTIEIPRLDGRIVGGSSTSIRNYPYQISLQKGGSHICGGSIISTQWVLTAAHCLKEPLTGYAVRAGSSTHSTGGTVYGVTEVIIHPKYSSNVGDYDIAVIRISGTFTFSDEVQPVRLATSAPVHDTAVSVTGWGTTTEGGSVPYTLQVVILPIVSNEDCNSYLGGLVTARMLCAGVLVGGKDACQGDSGGPLVLANNHEQVGIVSWGYGCARPNFPGVYANVANLRSWICSTTKEEAICGSCIFKSQSLLLFLTVLLALYFYL